MNRFFCSRSIALASALSSLALCYLLATPARALTPFPNDDFQDGTTMNWMGSTTTNAPNEGPGGVGDAALLVSSGNRVVVHNTSQWAGDFTGIERIALDIRQANPNLAAMQMRIGISNGPFGPNGSGDTYVTNDSVPVPNDNAWHHIEFNIRPSDFVPHSQNTNPTPDAAAALASVTHLRILHSLTADFRGAQTSADFYLDNIHAVPEPSSAMLAGAAGLGLLARRRARRR